MKSCLVCKICLCLLQVYYKSPGNIYLYHNSSIVSTWKLLRSKSFGYSGCCVYHQRFSALKLRSVCSVGVTSSTPQSPLEEDIGPKLEAWTAAKGPGWKALAAAEGICVWFGGDIRCINWSILMRYNAMRVVFLEQPPTLTLTSFFQLYGSWRS